MEKICVGYARVDFTPDEPIPLYGYGISSARMSNRVLDRLFLTCLAFVDELGERALIYGIDACTPGNVCTERWRPAVSRVTGVPDDRIMVSATHTHSGPAFNNFDEPSIERLKDRLEELFIQAAQAAIADCKPASASCANVETQHLTFVRRYVLKDGSYAGANYGRFDRSPVKCPESKADSTLRLLKFQREGDKDILVANFQAHPLLTGGETRYDISSDFVGPMRDKVEQELNCHMLYITGGAGNLNPMSVIECKNRYGDHVAHGQALADYAVKAEGTYEPIRLGGVRSLSQVKVFATNHAEDHKVEQAKKLLKQWKTPADMKRCTELAQQMGFNSVYHAEFVIQKAAMGDKQDIELNAIAIGDVAFVFANYEMFDTNANQIRNSSPFAFTCVCTSCNVDEDHGYMYIPSQLGYDHGGYSADSCVFAPGAGEKLASEYVHMLYRMFDRDEVNRY